MKIHCYIVFGLYFMYSCWGGDEEGEKKIWINPRDDQMIADNSLDNTELTFFIALFSLYHIHFYNIIHIFQWYICVHVHILCIDRQFLFFFLPHIFANRPLWMASIVSMCLEAWLWNFLNLHFNLSYFKSLCVCVFRFFIII